MLDISICSSKVNGRPKRRSNFNFTLECNTFQEHPEPLKNYIEYERKIHLWEANAYVRSTLR